jgi:membrane protein implicated in regulation of membrane protease activity
MKPLLTVLALLVITVIFFAFFIGIPFFAGYMVLWATGSKVASLIVGFCTFVFIIRFATRNEDKEEEEDEEETQS